MFDILLSGLFLFLITFLFKEPIKNWINKEPTDKFLKKVENVKKDGTTFVVAEISDNTTNSNIKQVLFQDLVMNYIVTLNLPSNHDFITALNDKKIIAIEYSVLQYKDTKIRVYPLIPEVEEYNLTILKHKIKEVESFKKTAIIFCCGAILIFVCSMIINYLLILIVL